MKSCPRYVYCYCYALHQAHRPSSLLVACHVFICTLQSSRAVLSTRLGFKLRLFIHKDCLVVVRGNIPILSLLLLLQKVKLQTAATKYLLLVCLWMPAIGDWCTVETLHFCCCKFRMLSTLGCLQPLSNSGLFLRVKFGTVHYSYPPKKELQI